MLLHRQVRVAFEPKRVFARVIGTLEAILHVAELKILEPVDVAAHAIVVQTRLVVGGSFLHAADRTQFAIVDIDQATRIPRSLFFGRGNRDNRVADEANVVGAQRVLVLTDR